MNLKKHIHMKNSILKATVVLLLAVVLSTGLWGTVMRAAAVESAADFTDFTDPLGSPAPMPQGDVVAGLLGGISPAEIDYLNVHGKYVLYTAAIPQDKMYAHVHQGGVTVVAHEYTYVTAEGMEITWVPFFAENLTTPSELVDLAYDSNQNLYVASLEGYRSDTIKVYYAASLTLDEDMALTLINEAPEKAQLLLDAMAAYETEMKLWLPKKEAYDTYVEAYAKWQTAVKAYEDYLVEKGIYDAWWAEHDLKQAAMDAYLTQKAAYEAWVQYGLDLKAYEDYMALVNASPELKAEYEAKMTTVLSHLSLMDRMFIVSDISGRSFEGVLNSGSADYIINNKDILLNISGVNKDDVNLAVASTRTLRKLVDEYKSLPDREAQYEYYIQNKAAMTSTLMDLYRSMFSLGNVEYVYKEIEDRGGLDAFRQFLGNLYVQGALMDDDTTLDPDIVLFDVPLAELIEPALTPEDHNATAPLDAYPHPPVTSDDVPEVPYPGDPPPQAEDPGEAPDPVPDVSQAPLLPTEVLPAGDAPDEVLPPEAEPVPPPMNEQETALYEAALAGEVAFRTAEDLLYGGTFSVMMGGEVTTLSGRTVTITMMNYRGMLYGTQSLAFGSSLNDSLTPPRAYASNGALLTFVGWSYEQTPLPDSVDDIFDTLETGYAVADMTLYPVYRLYHTPGAEATCTTPQTCTICGETLNPAKGHTPGAEATCTTPQTCTVCGETLNPAKGHTPGAEATCTTAQTCTVCGETLNPAKGHTPGAEATCTTPQTCTVCGETLNPAKGHTPGAEATCTTPQTCTVCGETLNPAKGHTPGAEATCTTPQTCTVCDEELAPANGHTPGAEATCTTPQTCTVCDEELTPAKGHNYKHTIQKPTCTEGGYTLHTCTGCGGSYKDHDTAPTGHRYGEWIVDRQPAPEVEGHRYAECQSCGYRMEEILPALPPAETDTQPPVETDTLPEPGTDTEPDTQEKETVTEPVTDTEPDTDREEGTETDTEPGETEGEVSRDTEDETPPEPGDDTQVPTIPLPEVKWYAKLLGAVGLPGLVTIAGVILGAGTAGITILVMRFVRKRRRK